MKVQSLALILLVIMLVAAPGAVAAPEAAPGNDDIANAVVINSLPYTSPTLDISQATEAGSDPQYPSGCYPSPETNYKPYRTVWYTYIAGQTTVLRVHTLASDYDTVLAVWHGSPGSLTLSGCNDDTSGSQQSLIDVWVTQGTTYYIEAGAYSAVETGNLVLQVEAISNLVFLPLALKN